MTEKTYVYGKDLEFMTGLGESYTEFNGQVATRQVSVLDNVYYASDSLQDYNPKIGFLLYDGRKDELDLSESLEISAKEFEAVWKKAYRSLESRS